MSILQSSGHDALQIDDICSEDEVGIKIEYVRFAGPVCIKRNHIVPANFFLKKSMKTSESNRPAGTNEMPVTSAEANQSCP